MSEVIDAQGNVVSENQIPADSDEVQKALAVLRQHGITPQRGDSFDDDSPQSGSQMPAVRSPDNIIAAISAGDTQQLASLFNLTPRQAKKVKSALIGGGTGYIHNVLSDQIGDELAAALGTLVSVYAAKKLIRPRGE